MPEVLQATTPLCRQGGPWLFTVAQVQGTVKYLMQSLARDSSLEAAGCRGCYVAVAAEHDGMEILCMSRHRGGMLAGALAWQRTRDLRPIVPRK